jgi:dihydropteroate synthase
MSRETTLGRDCQVWGVLNVTPDSFSDGGLALAPEAALARAKRMIADGADVIDIGGASSRPAGGTYGAGAAAVPVDEELARVAPVVTRVVRELGAQVSIDTVRAEVAAWALAAGARIVNDVSCGASVELLRAVAKHDAQLVLMHSRGDGCVAGANIVYRDVVDDVIAELGAAVTRACAQGIAADRIWLDPGIGFAKTAAQSVALLAGLPRLCALGHRVLVGPSRKSFVAELEKAAGREPAPPSERLGGSVAAVSVAVLFGADAVRVHDVREVRQAVLVCSALAAAGARDSSATQNVVEDREACA